MDVNPAHLFPWFAIVGLMCVGFAFGLIWERRHEIGRRRINTIILAAFFGVTGGFILANIY